MSYYIYKHLDKYKNIIYVGQTINMTDRQKSHLSNSEWKEEIKYIEYAIVSDKMLMDLYEKYYISKHTPKYNLKDIDLKYLNYVSLKELTFSLYTNSTEDKEKLLTLEESLLGKLMKLYIKYGSRNFSIKSVMETLNIKESQVYNCMNQLVDCGMVEKVKTKTYKIKNNFLNNKIK